jgi:septum formation protein
LGSQSQGRQQLLKQAGINYQIVKQDLDESTCPRELPFEYLLLNIARAKMAHCILPKGKENDLCFVLTADTMCQDSQGKVHGKPADKQEAIAQIKALRGQGNVGTAFCLERKKFHNGKWHTQECIEQCIITKYVFDIPDEWIEEYLKATPDYLTISGSITVDDFGAQFLKGIEGSYSNILGLPLFEVREALTKLGFFESHL